MLKIDIGVTLKSPLCYITAMAAIKNHPKIVATAIAVIFIMFSYEEKNSSGPAHLSLSTSNNFFFYHFPF